MKPVRQIVWAAMAAMVLFWALPAAAQIILESPPAASYMLSGPGASRVEIIGTGLGSEGYGTDDRVLEIANPETVDSMLVQVVLKVPPDITPSEEVYINNGEQRIHLETPTVITEGYGYHYEVMMKPAPLVRVIVESDTNEYQMPRAFMIYIFRKPQQVQHQVLDLVHRGLWWKADDRPHTLTRSYTIPPAPQPRDVIIQAVVTDKDSHQGRVAQLRAQAGAVVAQEIYESANLSDEALLAPLVLPDVPGDVTTVEVTLTSPDETGDSIFWSGLLITAPSAVDLGDAPEPGFPTLVAHNGASHNYRPGYHLGELIDTEEDGQPEINAKGDDFNGLADEDGVVLKSKLVQGQVAQLEITASAAGCLNAWIDLDGDGSWSQAGEHLLIDLALHAGVNAVSFTVPYSGLGTMNVISRFRFSSVCGLAYDGHAPDGEVEDYKMPLEVPVELSAFNATVNGNTVLLQWQTQSETENLGFHLYRSDSENGVFTQITSELINGAGNSSSAHQYSYVDRDVTIGQSFYYQLVDISNNGMMMWHGPVAANVIEPKTTRLEQNAPNPFNAQTRISYQIKQAGEVTLAIYNLQGQRVRTLVSSQLVPGSYSAIWDGRDDAGRDLPSGTYAYVLRMPDAELTQRMMLIK